MSSQNVSRRANERGGEEVGAEDVVEEDDDDEFDSWTTPPKFGFQRSLFVEFANNMYSNPFPWAIKSKFGTVVAYVFRFVRTCWQIKERDESQWKFVRVLCEYATKEMIPENDYATIRIFNEFRKLANDLSSFFSKKTMATRLEDVVSLSYWARKYREVGDAEPSRELNECTENLPEDVWRGVKRMPRKEEKKENVPPLKTKKEMLTRPNPPPYPPPSTPLNDDFRVPWSVLEDRVTNTFWVHSYEFYLHKSCPWYARQIPLDVEEINRATETGNWVLDPLLLRIWNDVESPTLVGGYVCKWLYNEGFIRDLHDLSYMKSPSFGKRVNAFVRWLFLDE